MALSTSLFIAVGASSTSGQIGNSIDNGRDWSLSDTSIFSGAGGVVAGGAGAGVATDGKGNWVAVGQSSNGTTARGRIGYSNNNGNTWTLSNTGLFSENGGLGYGVATDGNGNWVAVGKNDTGARIGTSIDNGKNWSISNIGSLFDGTGGGGLGFRVATDGKGTWIAVGESTTTNQMGISNNNGTDWNIISTSLFSGGQGYGVATDGNGNWVAVGQDSTYSVQIGISNNNGSTWSQITTSLFSGGQGNGVATDGKGNWVALGYSVNGSTSTAQIGYSSNNGNSWSTSNIGSLFGGDGGYGVATDGVGNWVAVGDNGNTGQIGYSTNNGRDWSISTNSLFVGGSGVDVAAAPPAPVPIPASNICFLAGTPIKTDQGIVPIDEIDVMYHTIGNKIINYITQTVTVDKYLVLFKKNCLGRNWPSQDTIMTKDHKVLYKGELAPAYKFMNISPDVKKYKYNGEILYNVLMEEHETMNVNNLICETLHPDNIIAKLYRSRFTDYHNDNVIITMNESLQKRNLYGYKTMINRMAIM